MRSVSHLRLADEIAYTLNLFPHETTLLRDGSIVPDEWRNYPHHHGKNQSIIKQIVEARKDVLKGNRGIACYRLGIAFHYLADKWTLMSGSYKRHSKWEAEIERADFIDDIKELIGKSDLPSLDKSSYYELIQALDYDFLGKDETVKIASLSRSSNYSFPSLDINISYRVCLEIARSVLSPVFPPTEINNKIEKARKDLITNSSKMSFRLLWILGIILNSTGLILFSRVNIVYTALLGTVIFLVEIYSLGVFYFKQLSTFKQLKEFRSIFLLWLLLSPFLGAFLIVFLVLYNYLWTSLTFCILGIYLQLGLIGRLSDKVAPSKLYSYISWFNEPKPSSKMHNSQLKTDNFTIPIEQEKVNVGLEYPQPNWELPQETEFLRTCPHCGSKYKYELKKCSNCGF